MAQGICELLWIKSLLKDLKVEQTDSMSLYCDNKVAISIAHNPVQHDRTKHVEIDRHFIKEKLSSGIICILFVKSGDQVADVLTSHKGNWKSTILCISSQARYERYICTSLRGSVEIWSLMLELRNIPDFILSILGHVDHLYYFYSPLFLSFFL